MTTRIFTSYTYGLSCNSKYDDERVVNVPPNQSISCPLCLYLLYKPKALSQCGHTFCRSCIAQWFCVFRNCPLCRKSGSFSDLEDPPSELKATMRSLRLRCMHSECNVVLSMGEMEKHEVKCSHQPSSFQSDGGEQQGVINDITEITNDSGGEDVSNRNGIESPLNQFDDFEENSPAYDSHYLDIENDLVYRIVRQATSRVFNSAEWNMLRFSWLRC